MPPPRILIVMPDDGKRALLRAALREVGYDAVGATTADDLRSRASSQPGRGDVRLIVIDQDVVSPAGESLRRIVESNGARVVLLAHATHATPVGPWSQIVRRPVSVADLVSVVQSQVPLSVAEQRPVDSNRPESGSSEPG